MLKSMEYVNTNAQRRVWPALRGSDGSTLDLGPGETVELSSDPQDPYLKAKRSPRKPVKDDEAPDTKELS